MFVPVFVVVLAFLIKRGKKQKEKTLDRVTEGLSILGGI
jgi:hypothetical protein